MAQTDIRVHGMTCEHCVNAVTEELKEVPGVREVDIDLVSGGDSPVHIVSDGEVSAQAISDAVDEAGYSIAS